MKLPEIKNSSRGVIPHHSNFTVLVENCVGEYEIPESENVTIRPGWNGYKVQEIVSLEHPKKSEQEHEEILKKIFNRWKDKEMAEEVNWACSETILDEEHCYSDFYEITFWATEQGFEQLIKSYLDDFKGYLMGLWDNRGADDDYYDYLPSITDIYYALCEFFEMEDEWEDFKAWLVDREKIESEDDWEEPLYRS
jgi:hypothetical protein